MDPQSYPQSLGPSTSYASYATSSNPPSTHSSPRSYPSDIESHSYSAHHHPMHSQSYPIPGSSTPFPPVSAQQQPRRLQRPPHHSYTAPVPLQVSTSTSSSSIEHDPNESTARPGNAHKHAQFHSLPLSGPAASGSSGTASGTMNGDESGAATAEDATEAAMKDYTASTPGLSGGLSRPLTQQEQDRLAQLDKLKFFLATAPSRWDPASTSTAGANPDGWAGIGGVQGQPGEPYNPPHPALNRFLLPTQEFVTCVLWKGLYHITGTDIVRALVFRFEAFGRPVRNMKKFEEGVFSDLRNLKPGIDATLEEPKSPFLDLLFKYQCIRTQKKQKVFYWFSVPHDRLFLDALERDLKREKMSLDPTTQVVGEPALSFSYDPKRSLYEQFSKAQGVREGEGELEAAVRHATEEMEDADESEVSDGDDEPNVSARHKRLSQVQGSDGIFPMVSLFEGSPTYKQRKKRNDKSGSGLRKGSEDDERGRGRSVGSNGSGERYGSSVSVSRERIPRPAHASMLEEFGPGSLAAKAEMEPSAAEMFHKQARGELLPGTGVPVKRREQAVIGEVGVYYEGQPAPPTSAGYSQQRDRSQDAAQRDFLPAGYNTATFSHPLPQPVNQPQNNLAAIGFTATSQYEAVSADGKVKAYVCPLFSCGRLFKRMEHLKRHLRTHTMERPFTCNKCNKKFSRSDNLNQHLKTHERALAAGASVDEWVEDPVDSDVSAGGDGNMGPGSGGESEEDGAMGYHHQGMPGLGIFSHSGGPGGMDVDMQMFDVNNPSAVGGFNVSQNLNLFEVEVTGGVTDVQGDEEGLIMRSSDGSISMVNQHHQGQDAYYPTGASTNPSAATGILFSAPPNTGDFTDPQWATRGQHSPAFSSVSAPSPPPGSMTHIRNSNRNSFHAPIRHTPPSSSSSTSSVYTDDYPVSASLSAPSHKQAFDHSALYPPTMIDANSAGGAGPIRRHRSMTPSVARSGEQTRRPVTANGTEYTGVTGGSPGSSSSMSSTRGYHPYAGYGSSSRGGSTHSSPAVYPVPLAGDYPQGRRSESRNSSYGGALQEQMRQMMNMTLDHQEPANFGDGAFRTDSPSFQQTESPAAFNMDLPVQYSNESYHSSNQAGFNKQGQFVVNGGMQVQDQQQPQFNMATSTITNGYYSHPQHVTM